MKKLLLSIIIFVTALLSCSAMAATIAPANGDTHPYVYLSDDFVSGLYNEDGTVKEAYAQSYSYMRSLASNALPAQPEDGCIKSNISSQLMARALMYALGEFDYEHARDTIEYTLIYLKYPKTAKDYSIDMYKDLGTNAIQTGALVYDWCYDAFTEEEKVEIGELILEAYKDTNGDGYPNYTQPCLITNPAAWTDIAGKAVGQPLIYNCIAVTALYDQYPEIYHNVMDKVQGTMAKAIKAYGSAGALSDGSISYTRDWYTYYIYVLFQRLGAEQFKLDELYGDQQALGYKMLYSRTPYGAMIRQGDGFAAGSYTVGNYGSGSETTDLGLLASMYENGYFRFNFLKENYGAQSLLNFLTMDCEVEPKLHDDLPLAYETKSPRTEIMTRTSWQDGVNSPAVFAYMNMNERRTGDHDHAHIGSFQLYYKGPLTMPGGIYTGTDWGKDHWRNYYTRTIAANCMTVYNPDEKFPWSNINLEANDGGQKVVKNWVISQYSTHFADTNIWAETESTYIGPNAKTPAFSYLKGDITKAYSSEKMESYKRGMVFMDTFNHTYPGVMIVFDRVVSKDASFKKKWLLQSVNDADVSGNKITITNTMDGANGKLVNKTLMPSSVEIEEVGGFNKYISDGKEYPAPVDSYTGAYSSGFRLEVSPKEKNTEDIFLNAMYVTDADGNAPELQMTKEETDEFVGVTTLDRQVYFSKSGEFISEEFSINVRNNNGGGKMLCLVTDVNPGKWKVSGSGVNLTLEALENDNCLIFSVAPGTYTITPASSTATVTSITWEETEKEKFGDFVVELDTCYMYLPDETYLSDEGIPYLSAKTCENLGKNISVETSGNTVTVNRNGYISTIKVGDLYYDFNGKNISIENPAIIHNSKIYLPIEEFCSAFAVDCKMVERALSLKITSGKMVSTENLLVPVEVSGYDKASIIADGVVGEAIEFKSFIDGNKLPVNKFITLNFGDEVKKIDRIDIAANGSLSFELMSSLDGNNFYRVPYEIGETFDGITTLVLPESIYARYIKFTSAVVRKISEVAVYGESASGVSFADKKLSYIFTDTDLEVQAFVENGFSEAGIYIDETKVYNFTHSQSGVYDIVIPATKLAGISSGVHEVKMVADYSGETVEDGFIATFSEGEKKIEIANLDFSQTTIASLFKSYKIPEKGSYLVSRNTQNSATESLVDGVYRMDLNANSTSGPYLILNLLAGYDSISQRYVPLENGVVEAKFDLYISSEDVSLTLEPRNKHVHTSGSASVIYPTTGPSYHLFHSKKGLFEVTLKIDTLNSCIKMYTREIDEKTGERSATLKLEKEIYFVSDGLGQIRLTFMNRGSVSNYWTIDNYTVNYTKPSKEMGMGILTPEYSKKVECKNVLLSACAEGADEVTFCINGKEVKKFTTQEEDAVYEFETTFEEGGIKYFDVYVKIGNEIYLKSSQFVYSPAGEKGVKTYDGPFVPKEQGGYCWINTTSTSAYFAGRVVFEGELTLTSTTDRVYFELGGASDYSFTFGGTNYITLSDAPGYGNSSVALFNENGKIADTDYTYVANTPMNIKYVCDTITDTYEIYIDGVKVLTKAGVADAGAGKTGNLVSAKIVGCKVRLVHLDADESGDGLPSFRNVRTYQEFDTPEITAVTYDGNNAETASGFVVPDNADEITISLSKEYSSVDEAISVKLDGIEVSPEVLYNSASKTITLKGLDLSLASTLDVTISQNATVNILDAVNGRADEETGIALNTIIYVGDADRVCVLPVVASINNGLFSAYSKYINASSTPKECSMILVEYANDDLSLVRKTNYETVVIKAKTSGIVSGYVDGIVAKQNCRALIWNKDWSPVTTAAAIE